MTDKIERDNQGKIIRYLLDCDRCGQGPFDGPELENHILTEHLRPKPVLSPALSPEGFKQKVEQTREKTFGYRRGEDRNIKGPAVDVSDKVQQLRAKVLGFKLDEKGNRIY